MKTKAARRPSGNRADAFIEKTISVWRFSFAQQAAPQFVDCLCSRSVRLHQLDLDPCCQQIMTSHK